MENQNAAPTHQATETRFTPQWRDLGVLILNKKGELVCDSTTPFPTNPEDFEAFGKEHENCVACAIRHSDHKPFPFYRFTFGMILRSGKFVPSLSPRVILRDGSMKIDNSFYDMMTMVEKAEQWFEKQLAWQSDALAKSREQHVRSPGKTERQRAKGKAKPKHD